MKYDPIKIQSINIKQGNEINDLELFFLSIQALIRKEIKNGKKGQKLSSGDKLSYKKMQGILYALNSYFGTKGCFSFGICGSCTNFNNSGNSSGLYGKCKGKDVHCFDTCNEHSIQGGGFGL